MGRTKRAQLQLTFAASLLSAVVSFQSLMPSIGFATEQQVPGEFSASSSTSSEVVVPPWCNWILNFAGEVNLQPINIDNGEVIDNFIYDGTEQNLSSLPMSESYYLAGQDGLTAPALERKCSWFGSPSLGVGVFSSMNRGTFQAYYLDSQNGNVLVRDSGMDIVMTGDSNPFNSQRDFDSVCQQTANSFDLPATGGETYFGSNWSNERGLFGVSPSKTTTNNFCSAQVTHSFKIPAGLTPLSSNTQYVWQGPTITYTSVFFSTDADYLQTLSTFDSR